MDEDDVEEPLALPSVFRERRFIHDRGVNVTLVEYLDTGTWYLAIYNDGIGWNEVSGWCCLCWLSLYFFSLFLSLSLSHMGYWVDRTCIVLCSGYI